MSFSMSESAMEDPVVADSQKPTSSEKGNSASCAEQSFLIMPDWQVDVHTK